MLGWIRKEIRIKKKEEKTKKGKEKQKGEEKKRNEQESEKKKVLLLFKIYRNRTVGFGRSKKKSRSTHRELRVGYQNLGVSSKSMGKNFSTRNIFSLKVM